MIEFFIILVIVSIVSIYLHFSPSGSYNSGDSDSDSGGDGGGGGGGDGGGGGGGGKREPCMSKLDCPNANGNRNSTSNIYCDNTGGVKSISINGGCPENYAGAYFELISSDNGKGCTGTLSDGLVFNVKTPGSNYNSYNNILKIYKDSEMKIQLNCNISYLEVILDEKTSSYGKCISYTKF